MGKFKVLSYLGRDHKFLSVCWWEVRCCCGRVRQMRYPSIVQSADRACVCPPQYTKEEAITKLQEKYWHSVLFDGFEYSGLDEVTWFGCVKCGHYWQSTPARMLNRRKQHPCPICTNSGRRISQQAIVDRFRGIHGDRYDYSKVAYTDMHTKVEIICTEHGSFWQQPKSHLAGYNCPVCGGQLISQANRTSAGEFVEQARQVHGDQYDYSQAEYANAYTKIKIICSKHGPFWQTPGAHLHSNNRGAGCPLCALEQVDSRGVTLIIEWLDSNGIKYEREKRFDDCRDTRPLPFDFHLPDYNILLEYHGKQHYIPQTIWGGDLGEFEALNQRDKIKKEWAIANGYQFIELSYEIPDTEIHEELNHVVLGQWMQ